MANACSSVRYHSWGICLFKMLDIIFTARKWSCGKVMVLHLSVCPQEECLLWCYSTPLPGQYTPRQHPPDSTPPDSIPSWTALPGQHTSFLAHPLGSTLPSQQAGGTHPTGILSCFIRIFIPFSTPNTWTVFFFIRVDKDHQQYNIPAIQ